MAAKNTKPARAVSPNEGEALRVDEDAPDSPLTAFSRELAQRFPNRMIRRYVMPRICSRDAREVFMIEMTSRDEVQAAIMADALMSEVEKRSVRLSADAERREAVRLSIVGIGVNENKRDPDSPVRYRHTNEDGEPLDEITDWTGKSWTALQTYFGTLNGVPEIELAEGLVGAQTVGAFAPPTSATRASADNGK